MFRTPTVIPQTRERTLRINTVFFLRAAVEKKRREIEIGTRSADPVVTMRRKVNADAI